MRKFKCKIPIDKFLRFQSSWKCACNSSKFNLILVPKRPRSFWEARRITTSGMVQCLEHAQKIRCVFSANHINCQSWLWACAEWREVRERGLSMLVLLRGRDSWCWLKEARPLGTRIVQSLHIENGSTTWLVRNPRFSIDIRISSLTNSTESIFLLFSTYIA